MSNSLQTHGLWPTRLHPWDFPGKSTGVGCHCLLQFCAKVGSIKDRRGKDLTEAEEIKKKWQECTEELYKKGLNHPDNLNGIVSHWSQTSWSAKWTLKHSYKQS